ncbi:MAG: hypothetical protein JOZ78_09230 [Chroococcidiopsidaceae cyanobacterium CP_BM_ER_R8_30]|nr:hypothetical protein [Chroococcidiopsidaceae cyanobacterium CP_BM_ER_R8_30]
MGLAIAQAIVLLHQGTISVTSELGVGSCFSVRLPPSQRHHPTRVCREIPADRSFHIGCILLIPQRAGGYPGGLRQSP